MLVGGQAEKGCRGDKGLSLLQYKARRCKVQVLLQSSTTLLVKILCKGSVGPSRCGQDWVGVACAAVGNRYGLDNSTWHGTHDAFMRTLGNYPLTSPPVSPN